MLVCIGQMQSADYKSDMETLYVKLFTDKDQGQHSD